ncbi:response regulator [Bdellovibrio sp. qaytius]|nr:response regulator [Bdellovibrio sp. qaytius]
MSEKHILLAEDGEVHARILQATLGRAGYKLHWVTDGVKAYEAIKSGVKYDLLITDVMMPGMSGFELLTRLKNENILPPTIVLTGVQNDEDVLRGIESGALYYIKKPFSPSVVLAHVKLVFNQKAA